MKMNWGTGIVMVLIVFFAALAVIVTIAMRQRNDLVAEDYYARELKHEEQMDRERRAAGLSGRVRAVVDEKFVIVTFPDELDAHQVQGRLQFYRPDDERKDFEIPIALDSAHSQRIPRALLTAGAWRTKAAWMYRGQEYYTEQALTVP